MKRNFSDITPDRDTDTPDTIIDCDCKNIDSQMQGLIDTISEYITLGNWKVANELIDENLIDINSISSCGNSFLHTAIIHDHLEIVRELLNLEADPDSLSADGLRSLSLSINSCTKNFKAVIKLLLKSGANPNLPNEDHSLPIHFAIQTGSFEIIESLIYFNITNKPAKSIF